MDTEIIAQGTLLGYALIALGVVIWQMLRSRATWGAWLLYVVNQTYLGLGFHWRSNRRPPFPAAGPALILANHRSPIDPQLIFKNVAYTGTLRPIGFLTAREYANRGGLVGWICRHMRSIPVSRDGKDMSAVREAIRRLQAGELVGVFPEGGVNLIDPGGLLPGNPGIAFLALSAQVPIYPVFIHNAPQGDDFIRVFYTFQRVRVTYGDPIDLSQYAGQKKTQALLNQVTNELMLALAALGNARYPLERPAAPTEPTAEEERTAP